MAKVMVDVEVIAERLFGWSEYPVEIRKAVFDPVWRRVEFDIDGPDIPAADLVTAEIVVTTNRAGEKLHSLRFVPVPGSAA